MVKIKNNQTVEPSRNKEHLRYSTLKNYFECPHKYQLSLKHDPVFNSSNLGAMMKGNIFETFALDMNDSRSLAIKEEYRKRGTIGRMKHFTVETVIKAAKRVNPWFVSKELINEEVKVNINLHGNEYILSTHPDFVGEILLPGMKEPIRAMADTKYTGSIERIWETKKSKTDFLQAILYPYVWFMKTGEYLPFVYIIAEHAKEGYDAQIQHKIIISKPVDHQWMRSVLEMVTGDANYRPNKSHYSCLGQGNNYGKCRFINFCEYGKELTNKVDLIQFENLDNR